MKNSKSDLRLLPTPNFNDSNKLTKYDSYKLKKETTLTNQSLTTRTN